jgi:phage tail-like protein
MANSERPDPFRGFCFILSIPAAGGTLAAFSEVTVPDITVNTVNYREGDEPTYQRTISGLTTYGSVSLRRGMTSSMDLYHWHRQVVEKGSSGAKRNVAITLLDPSGSNKIASWNLTNAWPTAYHTSGLNAASAEIMIESLELSIYKMERQ